MSDIKRCFVNDIKRCKGVFSIQLSNIKKFVLKVEILLLIKDDVLFQSNIEGGTEDELCESVYGASMNEVLGNDRCGFTSKPEMLVMIPDIPDSDDTDSETNCCNSGGLLSDRCDFLDQTSVEEAASETGLVADDGSGTASVSDMGSVSGSVSVSRKKRI